MDSIRREKARRLMYRDAENRAPRGKMAPENRSGREIARPSESELEIERLMRQPIRGQINREVGGPYVNRRGIHPDGRPVRDTMARAFGGYKSGDEPALRIGADPVVYPDSPMFANRPQSLETVQAADDARGLVNEQLLMGAEALAAGRTLGLEDNTTLELLKRKLQQPTDPWI